MTLPATPATRAVAVALTSVLLLGACGGGDEGGEQPDETTSQATEATEGASETAAEDETTAPGTELQLGESASFDWQPTQDKRSRVSVTVDRVDQGSAADLRAIAVNPPPKKPRLYYVRLTLENQGETDLAGASPISLPLYVNDGSSILVRPADLLLDFKPCPLQKVPARFTTGKAVDLCLVYLLDGAQLENVSLVPDLEQDAITWTGKVTEPQPPKKTRKQRRG